MPSMVLSAWARACASSRKVTEFLFSTPGFISKLTRRPECSLPVAAHLLHPLRPLDRVDTMHGREINPFECSFTTTPTPAPASPPPPPLGPLAHAPPHARAPPPPPDEDAVPLPDGKPESPAASLALPDIPPADVLAQRRAHLAKPSLPGLKVISPSLNLPTDAERFRNWAALAERWGTPAGAGLSPGTLLQLPGLVTPGSTSIGSNPAVGAASGAGAGSSSLASAVMMPTTSAASSSSSLLVPATSASATRPLALPPAVRRTTSSSLLQIASQIPTPTPIYSSLSAKAAVAAAAAAAAAAASSASPSPALSAASAPAAPKPSSLAITTAPMSSLAEMTRSPSVASPAPDPPNDVIMAEPVTQPLPPPPPPAPAAPSPYIPAVSLPPPPPPPPGPRDASGAPAMVIPAAPLDDSSARSVAYVLPTNPVPLPRRPYSVPGTAPMVTTPLPPPPNMYGYAGPMTTTAAVPPPPTSAPAGFPVVSPGHLPPHLATPHHRAVAAAAAAAAAAAGGPPGSPLMAVVPLPAPLPAPVPMTGPTEITKLQLENIPVPPPQKKGNTKRKVDYDALDDKRKNFLERNRQAAMKCRQRKKQQLTLMETKAEGFRIHNEQLEAQLAVFRDEVMRLRRALAVARPAACAPTVQAHVAKLVAAHQAAQAQAQGGMGGVGVGVGVGGEIPSPPVQLQQGQAGSTAETASRGSVASTPPASSAMDTAG
ncbi:hypothetical protein GGF32_007087 [Allomyces javanicus]|nr:hypothetical protein GGF32_007087 [Allomyces javanicus]